MPDTAATHPTTQLAQRRCWRCLQTLPTDEPVPARDDFWLCDPCDAILLPGKRVS
jgi:hypothetical protein